jgi:putative ATP-binding cassette transporter
LLANINQSLYADGGITSAAMWAFFGLVVLTLSGEIISDLGNSFIGQQIIAGLRTDLVGKIVAAPLAQIERYKEHRLLSALGQDVDTISSFTYSFSSYAIAFAVCMGCMAYLVFLSPLLFTLTAVAIGLGVWVTRLARNRGRAYQKQARAEQDTLYKFYRAIIEGAKELRINRQRREQVHARHLVGTIQRVRDLRFSAFRIFMSANALDSALYFALIGVILAWQGAFGVERTVVSGFILVLLYMRGPLNHVLGAYGSFVNAQISFGRIARLSRDFSSSEPCLASDCRPDLTDAEGPQPSPIEAIQLESLAYTFPAEQGVLPFTLGPIDLTIHSGEMLFIVGENGCGKTTLIKLILGLYEADSGTLRCNGEPVTAQDRDACRQQFSAVFFDYFLFDELALPDGARHDAADRYMRALEIAHKVSIDKEGRFSTVDLSAGQRKRLALVQVYLEGRPVIVFDEWAAEQDPTFRRIFYTEVLPDLKRQGKTLIVISHDDRYFNVADRVVYMKAGKISRIVVNEPMERVSDGHVVSATASAQVT